MMIYHSKIVYDSSNKGSSSGIGWARHTVIVVVMLHLNTFNSDGGGGDNGNLFYKGAKKSIYG